MSCRGAGRLVRRVCVEGCRLDLKKDPIKKLYFHYLLPCLFSGLVTTIYSLVDTIVVGQYEGSAGTAALACVAPLWSFICSLGLLFGVGGSVLLSRERGRGDEREGNRYFTAALIGLGAVLLVIWLLIILGDRWLLGLFGADEALMPLARRYVFWLKFVIPLYPLSICMGAFIRSDGDPRRAGFSVAVGGIFNIFGDLFFTFGCDMGISGAGLATAIGQLLATAIQMTHFLSKKNTLRLVRPERLLRALRRVLAIGSSSFVVDVCMGVLIVLFNNQIMRYFGADELAIYGVASSVFVIVQTTSYGVGNACQPLLSENYGAGKPDRISQTLRLGMITAAIIAVVLTTVTMLIPRSLVGLYMDATQPILDAAPGILRPYFTCLPFVVLSVFSTFYLQAVMRARISVVISLLRGVVVSGALLFLLPALLGKQALWWSLPVAELLVAVFALTMTVRTNRQLRRSLS